MIARSGIGRVCVLLSVLAFTAACASLVDRIPPHDMTVTSMGETLVRIQMYMRDNGETPPTLAALPIRPGHMNRTTDGWGRELQYMVDENGVISLTSLGADGKPGGDGPNKDLVQRYRTRNPDGSSCINDEFWIIDAEIQ